MSQPTDKGHQPSATELDATIDAYLAAWTEVHRDHRAALIARVWVDDGQLEDAPFTARGPAAISRLAAIRQVEFSGYSYRRIGRINRDDHRFSFTWEFVQPDGVAAIRGFDAGELAADGRLREVIRRYHTSEEPDGLTRVA
jgi:hypothetical protein